MHNNSLHPKKRNRKAIYIVAFMLLTSFCPLFSVKAEETESYVQDKAVYDVYIEDYAGILTEEDEDELYDTMLEGSEYGNMVFMTIEDAEDYETKDYVEMIYRTSEDLSGTDAVIYLIDMDNRMLWITGYGGLQKRITADYGNLITDNVYKYAKSGDYARCAINGYRQIILRLGGERVSGPLRGVGNFCIAVIVAEILCFVSAYAVSVSRRTENTVILENLEHIVNLQNPEVKKAGTRKVYDPQSSSSGSSGGSRSGGGGFSGGGGGHGF